MLLAVVGLLGVLSHAGADSLWDRRDPRLAFLFEDTRARKVGDLLTIVVRETTDINESDQRQLRKESKAGGLFNFKGNTKAGRFLSRDATIAMDTSGSANRRFDGRADYTSDRRFVDRMTVTVVDVQPNGNLVIEGCRRRTLSGEERVLRVTGVVRPVDIGSGNVIQSQSIANFQVTYEGRGAESSFSNQGWFSQFLNHVWPF
jgi:flagellar L-ring protein precursor FlgH